MKRQVGMVLCVSALLSVLPGCNWFGSKKEVVKEQPKVLVVNVLDKEYYDDCHIPGSIQVSLSDLEEQAKQWSHDSKIVIYCANYACTASGSCAKTLKNLGFEHVCAYEAGMAGWYQAGNPVEGAATQEYLKAENKPLEGVEASDVSVITTEELQALLKEDVKEAATEPVAEVVEKSATEANESADVEDTLAK